ncbi:Uncharacterised protein [uncultured archaeon]|nr:Uncharacterised protein [uncultured archaeon]
MNLIGIALALIGYIIAILEYTKEPRISTRLIIIIALSTLALGITIWDLQKQENEKLALSNTGEISSNLKNVTYPCIYWGITRTENGPGGVSPIVQIVNDKMYVQVENGKLKISAIVRDESGKIMGDIKDNVFEAIPPYAPRSRHDDTGWEVLDPYGRVALQVDLIGSCAHIAGIFYSEDGTVAFIFPNKAPWIILQGPKGQINQNITELWMENPNIITPIFDYRSDKHGERVKK